MQNTHAQPLCIVTGGSYGIGAAVCDAFLAKGYRVVNLDISPGNNSQVQWLSCDMTDTQQVNRCIQQVCENDQRIDVLVSNAGKHYSATIENTPDQDFDKLFSLNVKGAIAATKAVLPMMKQQQKGVLLYISSEQALVAKPNSFAYNLTKSALASLAKTTALDYAKFNIRSNAVCPGTVETPLYHQAIDNYVAKSGADEAAVHAEEAALQPLGRIGKPEEVAALCCFLASDDAAFITGSLQVIDGGYTAQ